MIPAAFYLVDFHGFAANAAERFIYSALAGTALAAAVWFLLQVFSKKDSRTSFIVWFSTLLATALLPLVDMHSSSGAGEVSAPHAVFTISTSWALYLFLAWAVIAFAGLVRVAFATLQVRKLRASAVEVEPDQIDSSLHALMTEARRSRPVALMVSSELEVPTAIGFYKPAIILPQWLLESTPAEELKYILLHELTHLRRRDDWTNLAQKVLKAVLFFLPSVWWIERKLSLDREMACDDAVLACAGSPRGYAECLARVAERSFLRRQIALAQAAVGRVRQLTTRVAMILDPNRPRSTQTQIWKPAIPVVMVLAGLAALPASFAPELVHFSDGKAQAHLSAQAKPSHMMSDAMQSRAAVSAERKIPGIHAVQTNFKTDENVVQPVAKRSQALRSQLQKLQQKNVMKPRAVPVRKIEEPPVLAASLNVPANQPAVPQFVAVREELVVTVTQQSPTGEQESWQMHVVQVSLQPQTTKPVLKPRKI